MLRSSYPWPGAVVAPAPDPSSVAAAPYRGPAELSTHWVRISTRGRPRHDRGDRSDRDTIAGCASVCRPFPRAPIAEGRSSIERQGPVTVVTIDRPEVRNAVDSATAEALRSAFEDFDDDPDAAVAVLTGAGGTFCAGADLKALTTGDRRPVHDDGPGPMGPTRMTLSKPVVAAVEGYAVAGGLELALWCDLRVAAEDAVFGVFCRRFGVPLVDLGTVRLPRLIGASRAMDMILTGRAVRGPEALTFGLANRLCAPGEALTRPSSWPGAGRAPPGLPAQRPPLGPRAVGAERGRGRRRRGPART